MAAAQEPERTGAFCPFHDRVDGDAPAGVMGAHHHPRGTWMFSYRLMATGMRGNRDGFHDLTPTQVQGRGYAMVPDAMRMFMHMFSAMYAAGDRVTLMAMLPVDHMWMSHQTGTPIGSSSFSVRPAGLGDVSAGVDVALVDGATQRVTVGVGASLPTGAVRSTSEASTGQPVLLDYAMRFGAGSVAILPSATYTGHAERVSWGAQLGGTLPAYRNRAGYRASLEGRLTGWVAYRLADSVSSSLRVAGAVRGNLRGEDPLLDPTMMPTGDPRARGGRVITAYAGLNFLVRHGDLAGLRFGLELGLPVLQNLDGPQLATRWELVGGLSFAL